MLYKSNTKTLILLMFLITIFTRSCVFNRQIAEKAIMMANDRIKLKRESYTMKKIIITVLASILITSTAAAFAGSISSRC